MASVKLDRHGLITTIALARPATGNALAVELVTELAAALAAAPQGGTRAVILTGTGAHFCTGADLGELAASLDAPEEVHVADATRLGALYAALLRCPLYTVAAVRGAAYGGGAGLAAACDLVVAAPDARFQFSETRIGFVPALVSTFLPRRVAAARLNQLFVDPSPLDAAAAQAAGLVDEIAAEPLAYAERRALEVSRKTAPSALAESKRLLLAATLPGLDHLLADAARANARQRTHPECRRGLAAFLATRSFPDWLDES